MNLNIAKNRLNEVIEVDSILSKESDFLLTHVPFRQIKVRNGLKLDSLSEYFSEESFFEKYFVDTNIFSNHQFIIVEGSSGTGKSHFIRWLNAKLKPYHDTDVVILIRRDDNTLKGTIQQLLNIDEIKNLKNKDTYERLVKANKTISDSKFKNEIFYHFVSELDSNSGDDNEEILTTLQKKQLLALMTNERFKQKLLSPFGPIERIFHKIVNNGTSSPDEIAEFTEQDFILDTDFGDVLTNDNADKKAIKMVNKLIPDDEGISLAPEVAKYLNSMVDEVIQSSAGIEPGDFQQIFKEIRQELKRQNKNLILLIEDVTSFTGVNQALLNALVTGHTGMYAQENLCRLISVVGTTSQYYASFRDNYKDRITAQVTIEDGAIGSNRDDLFDFFAKYLNAMSLPSDVGEKWALEGAEPKDYPIHDFEYNAAFDEYEIYGKKTTLYPFTKRAIENLYDSMESQKTPRHILREIIEPAINDLIYRKTKFLTFLSGKNIHPVDEHVDGRIRSVAASSIENEKERIATQERVLALVAIYGTSNYKTTDKSIYGVKNEIWVAFGLEEIGKRISKGMTIEADDEEGSQNEETPPVKTIVKQLDEKNPEYEAFLKNLNNWYSSKAAVFARASFIRDEINTFVFQTMDWQQNGISYKTSKIAKDSTKDLFSFERQDRAESNGLIKLPANDETRQLLICFGKYKYLGKETWNFKGSYNELFFVTKWLKKYTPQIVNVLTDNSSEKSCPAYVEAAICVDLMGRLLSDCDIGRLSSINQNTFLNEFSISNGSPSHGDKWNDTLIYLNQNSLAKEMNSLYLEYFTINQGRSLTKRVINYSGFSSAIAKLKKNNFVINPEDVKKSQFKDKNEALNTYSNVYKKVEQALNDEKQKIETWITNISNVFGFDEDDEIDKTDIGSLLREIKNFYSDSQKAGFYIQNKEEQVDRLLSESDSVVKAIQTAKKALKAENLIECLIYLNGNTIKAFKEIMDLLSSSLTDLEKAESSADSEEERLKRCGVWIDNTDPRFAEHEKQFDEIYKEINEEYDL